MRNRQIDSFLDELEIDKSSLARKIAIFLEDKKNSDYDSYVLLADGMSEIVHTQQRSLTERHTAIKNTLSQYDATEFCQYVDMNHDEFERSWRLAAQFIQILYHKS